jgi:uncharacterized protein YwqG
MKVDMREAARALDVVHRADILEACARGIPLETVKKGLRLATRLHGEDVDEGELPVGASRFGGRPDLPSSLRWPRWQGYAKADRLPIRVTRHSRRVSSKLTRPRLRPAALSFLAQLNLADIPDATGLLPEAGWLAFFYDAVQQPWGFDPKDRGSAQVLYFEGDAQALRRARAPRNVQEFSPMKIMASPMATLPRAATLGMKLDGSLSTVYGDLANKRLAGPEPHHRVLGWPKQVQPNNMPLQCLLVTNGIYLGSGDALRNEEVKRLAQGGNDWMLLLQLDTDDNGPGWSWGDGGCLSFWIRRRNLAARRFEDVWAILQSH